MSYFKDEDTRWSNFEADFQHSEWDTLFDQTIPAAIGIAILALLAILLVAHAL